MGYFTFWRFQNREKAKSFLLPSNDILQRRGVREKMRGFISIWYRGGKITVDECVFS